MDHGRRQVEASEALNLAAIEISCAEVLGEVFGLYRRCIRSRGSPAHGGAFQGLQTLRRFGGTWNVVRLVSDGHAYEVPAGFSARLMACLARRLGKSTFS
jgi:hypothetical protein